MLLHSKKEAVDMQISGSGRIVLIDDKLNEIKPLLEAMGKNSIPYLYYDGNVQNLPGSPPGGIRFVFLDIELEGMKGQDDKTKASGIAAILKRIISDSNGPYVIIFWTKHKQVIELVIRNCKSLSIPPVCWLDLDKPDCIDSNGKYDIQGITDKLGEKLSGIGAFQLYVKWENIVNTASKQFVYDFSSLAESGNDWSKSTAILFYNLYKAYVDKNVLTDKTEQFKCACHLINRSFLDTLEDSTSTMIALPDEFWISNGTLDCDTKAKLNSSLFLGKNILPHPSTGCVYVEEDDCLQNSLKKNLFKEERHPELSKLCAIIITPECDLAQNKTIKVLISETEDSSMHRIVYGLFCPLESSDLETEKKKLHDRGKDARFIVGPLWHEGKTWFLIIHFSTLSFQPEDKFSREVLFTLKRDLLFDLQSKAAIHVNRLGNFQLG